MKSLCIGHAEPPRYLVAAAPAALAKPLRIQLADAGARTQNRLGWASKEHQESIISSIILID
jgi:hypothetical protein